MSPPLAVLATLALILIVPRKVPLWVSFLGACLVLPFLAGEGIAGSVALWTGILEDVGIRVFVVFCAGVFVLSSILTHGGHLAVLCDFASALIPSRRLRAAVMPALVGLIPMPGGAVVSAPLIDRSLGEADVSPSEKNLINYWFRHIWEVSWPLYPAVLFAASYLRVGDNRFFLSQAFLTIVLAGAGFFVLLRRIPEPARDQPERTMPKLAKARAALPLAALIGLPLLWRGSGELRGPVAEIGLAVVVAIVLALLTAIDFVGLKKVPFDRRIYSMTVLAFLVAAFGSLVREICRGTGMLDSGLPFWAFVLLAPFLVGFATGATLTFATATFPMIKDLLPGSHAPGSSIVPWLVLGYAAGFVGYLTSPVHMCLVLSTRYFNAKLLSAYARLAIPLLVFLGAAVGLFFALGGRFET